LLASGWSYTPKMPHPMMLFYKLSLREKQL